MPTIHNMTAPVDNASANERISRAIRAAMAARGVKDAKQLSVVTGIKYDTLLRRMDGKPWLASEILAVAESLDVDPRTLLEADPDDWFRRGDTQSSSLPVTSQPSKAATRRLASEHGLEFPHSGKMALSSAAA